MTETYNIVKIKETLEERPIVPMTYINFTFPQFSTPAIECQIMHFVMQTVAHL